MLELTKHPMKVAHLNLRTEMHGDEEVKCIDIRLKFDVPNTVLNELAKGLRERIYAKSVDPDMFGPDADHLTHVRYPQLKTLKWAREYSPVSLHIHSGGGKSKGDLLFSDAVFGKLAITPREGGTCSCEARALVTPNPNEVAKLVDLYKLQVPVTLDMSHAANDDEDGSGDQ